MRILGKDVCSLRDTDISEKALQEKQTSQLKNMVVLGRRGIIQSAFTLKELREIHKVDNLHFHLFRPDLERSLNDQSVEEVEARDR